MILFAVRKVIPSKIIRVRVQEKSSFVGIDRTLQKIARKTSPGVNKNIMNDGNQKAEPPENEDSQNLSGMAKAFLVSVAWSYAEALERMKRLQNLQKPAPESQAESQPESQAESQAESQPETVDRTFESN